MMTSTDTTSLVPYEHRLMVADDDDPFVDPARMFDGQASGTLEELFAAYARDLADMRRIASMFDGRHTEVLGHFLAANRDDHRAVVSPEHLFRLEPATKALDACYWDRALRLTDVLESMPQKRRDEWWELVKERKTPPFNPPTVTATLGDLLAQRHRFFAERIDGIFQSLSSEHLTNRPEGFSKRMIVAHVASGGYVDASRGGTLNDLRCVVARFMGRLDEPLTWQTHRAIDHAYRTFRGQWMDLDGGALRLRVYGNGNAHLEVHPDIAWRLNVVLASIHPTAIPQEHRRRPGPRKRREVELLSNPLPFAVLAGLSDGRFSGDGRVFTMGYSDTDALVADRVADVLMGLGATRTGKGFRFEHDARAVVARVTASGAVPDIVAHQFYPTPKYLAARLIEVAEIGLHDEVLEPSAGQGAIADLLPEGRSTLVEVSPLFCEILRAKGHEVVCTDFLDWKPGRRFNAIVMNPPFDRGRWRAHVEHAANLTASGGRLVALLPEGARQASGLLPGWSVEWRDAVPFPGTSIRVVMMIARKV